MNGKQSYPKAKKRVMGKRKRNSSKRGPSKRGADTVQRDKGVQVLDQFGRMKPPMYKTHRKSTPGLQNSLTTTWNSQMLSKVYAGAQAFDLPRKVFKEKTAATVFRSPTPLPWKNSSGQQLTVRQWIPKTD